MPEAKILHFIMAKRLMAEMKEAVDAFDIQRITKIYYEMWPNDKPSSPLDTPAPCLNNSPNHMPEYMVGNTYCSVCKIWLWAGPIPQPAPADTGANLVCSKCAKRVNYVPVALIHDDGTNMCDCAVAIQETQTHQMKRLASTGDTPQPQDVYKCGECKQTFCGNCIEDHEAESHIQPPAATGKTPDALPDSLKENANG